VTAKIIVVRSLCQPCAWDGGDTHEGLMMLELIGMMVGKGLYEGILQEVQLAPFFAKALLG
jgi:hypothetical protein